MPSNLVGCAHPPIYTIHRSKTVFIWLRSHCVDRSQCTHPGPNRTQSIVKSRAFFGPIVLKNRWRTSFLRSSLNSCGDTPSPARSGLHASSRVQAAHSAVMFLATAIPSRCRHAPGLPSTTDPQTNLPPTASDDERHDRAGVRRSRGCVPGRRFAPGPKSRRRSMGPRKGLKPVPLPCSIDRWPI